MMHGQQNVKSYMLTLLWRASCPSRGIVSILKTERECFCRNNAVYVHVVTVHNRTDLHLQSVKASKVEKMQTRYLEMKKILRETSDSRSGVSESLALEVGGF